MTERDARMRGDGARRGAGGPPVSRRVLLAAGGAVLLTSTAAAVDAVFVFALRLSAGSCSLSNRILDSCWGELITGVRSLLRSIDSMLLAISFRRWSPVDFDIDDLTSRRLAAGTQTKVTGRVAGVPVRA